MATAMQRLLVVGLPRSGTTVVANSISSMESAFCFIEPHWEFKRHGTTDFFRDPKLRWMFFLRYQEKSAIPLDSAVRRIQGRYPVVGIKETFRGAHFSSYDQALPNEGLLASYVDAGYRLVPILRDPLSVWNSFCGHFPPDSWARDLGFFIENYQRLCSFAAGVDPLIYERFVHDPVREMARSGIAAEGYDGRLTMRRTRMGDPTAKHSTEVTSIERPVHYTEAEREALATSSIVELYAAGSSRSTGQADTLHQQSELDPG